MRSPGDYRWRYSSRLCPGDYRWRYLSRLGATRWRRVRTAAFALLVSLFATGCVTNRTQTPIDEGDTPQNFLEPVGRFAIEVDLLWNLVLIVAVAIFILVEGLIVWAIFRYRERPDDDRLPRQIHGNPRLEAMWTIIPAVILAIVAVPTVQQIFSLADRPDEALTVEVTGHMWWWEFAYPDYDGLVTANELHIPAGETVVLEMTSVDVIHSFWVPKLAGKQDVVPGRTNLLKLEAEEPGEFLGQCAEYCGLSHANMRARVIVQPREEFEAWAETHAQPLDVEQATGDAAAGRQQFVDKGCVGCHAIRGWDEAGGQVGPDLTYFADRDWFAGAIFENDIDGEADNVHDWLADPPAMKPMQPQNGIGMPDLFDEDDPEQQAEIDELVAFLRSLRSGTEQGD